MTTLRTTAAWLSAVADPRTRLEIDLLGIPALYTAQPGWRNQPLPFGQHLLYHVVHGSFRARFGKREETLNPDDLLWIAPWTPFLCWLPGNRPVTFYRFRLTVKNRTGQDLRLGAAPHIVRGLGTGRPWIEETVRHHDRPGGPFHAWRLRGALLGLFADALAPKSRASARGKLDLRQREALAATLHGDDARLTPAALAAHLRLTPDYFARLFRRTYGLSPRTWIVRERIKLAAVRVLESQRSIGEVAEEFGYRDIFFFSRQFKQVMGRSPLRYRRGA